jgi:hypothetical protein
VSYSSDDADAAADLERWFGVEHTAHLIEGLRKAGFEEK